MPHTPPPRPNLHLHLASCPPLDLHTGFTYWVLTQYNSRYCFAAELDGEICAVLTAVRTDNPDPQIYVWQVGVGTAARGLGLAGRLLEHLVAAMRRDRIGSFQVSIAPSNHSSLQVFTKFAERSGASLRPVGQLDVKDPYFKVDESETVYEASIPSTSLNPAMIAGEAVGAVRVSIYGNLLPGHKLGSTIEPYIILSLIHI